LRYLFDSKSQSQIASEWRWNPWLYLEPVSEKKWWRKLSWANKGWEQMVGHIYGL